ncbi:hypothetical protein TPADAL_0073a [Treponema pallidum subsp. pallidum DAL-1]|uniref:Uncharacterized protein n=2 Tax=Treponema pallidum TaxID=160 RepID=A0AAU8S8D3_TREPL|nr:hypothetical protein TPESAMD_0073a [Treponema pallidum subsp. pertenue str. SamoaD]AEZ58259.1 hypothetical protein TPECDC2_0073a [Treponema pallidum subsp. pertenue str. CDC2]AEZ59327.1 hypothetical protein TPEGAU_0073a [Treponema pallidum subsp. pertenue str. Gauthier]AEZ60392.1 hypothetical protein TPADAL_0073a [Treponema pallidum subsp. pallidum DAL-1]AGK83715.1 hypothetical protein TPFB_0073a [Treponema pallidum str. Fribourg-Blanc]AJB40091.1 hypothetical protein TENDBA_0073a [Treponema
MSTYSLLPLQPNGADSRTLFSPLSTKTYTAPTRVCILAQGKLCISRVLSKAYTACTVCPCVIHK